MATRIALILRVAPKRPLSIAFQHVIPGNKGALQKRMGLWIYMVTSCYVVMSFFYCGSLWTCPLEPWAVRCIGFGWILMPSTWGFEHLRTAGRVRRSSLNAERHQIGQSVNRSGSVRSSYKHPTISSCITKMRSLLSTQPLNLISQKTYRPKLSADSRSLTWTCGSAWGPLLLYTSSDLARISGHGKLTNFDTKISVFKNLQNLLRVWSWRFKLFETIHSWIPQPSAIAVEQVLKRCLTWLFMALALRLHFEVSEPPVFSNA